MTTTAGYCRYRRFTPSHPDGAWAARNHIEPYKIDLSDKLFRHLDYDLAKIENTLIHEMVHAYLVHKYNEKGHTRRFQQMMTNITGEYKNHRCHNYDTVGIRKRQEKKVKWTCSRCGFEGWKTRMPRNSSRVYKHNGCGGTVEFVDTRRQSTMKMFPSR
jgi:predicted RNA-binding Zn-ribbon protein involved in translation (DUF1610 family)